MRFWLTTSLLYVVALAAGLVLPSGTALIRQGGWPNLILWYGLASIVMALEAFVLTLIAAKLLFPQYWWLGQVLGQDVYEYQGVYFVGVRLSRVPSRLQRLLFGASEKFRRWDLAFGVIWLMLLVAHGLGAITFSRAVENYLPKPVRLPETMHEAMLSDLPVMRALGKRWTPDPDLTVRLQSRMEKLEAMRGKTEADWFRLAQLHLARAYKRRLGAADAYRFSPKDRAFFERAIGAHAAEDITQILAVPEAKRAPLTRGALTLLGFFHLSEYNYSKAEEALTDALASPKDDSGIPVAWTRLLLAQVALQLSDPGLAASLIDSVLAEPNLPKPLEALAVEHLSETMRLRRDGMQVDALLDRAEGIYTALGDAGGLARVHLHRAIWLADQGATAQGSQELSVATAQAEKADDIFALNMIVKATLLMPALR